MENTIQKLRTINWDFSDYNSSKYPLDLNSIPWYPATFVPLIPKVLIASLTAPGDSVLDPFGGKGTTAIESIKLNRIPIYNDYNPFACDIVLELFSAIRYYLKNGSYPDIAAERDYLIQSASNLNLDSYIECSGISPDSYHWYEKNTLKELIAIYDLIQSSSDTDLKHIRKLAFTSILKSASSQPGHFTYVTDNCKPLKLVYKKALELYFEKTKQIENAAKDLLLQFSLVHPDENLPERLSLLTDFHRVNNSDARDLSWIPDESIDLVVTSPPYLCAQDYMKTMRLINLFFPNDPAFTTGSKAEIGPRCKRKGKSEQVVPTFYSDLDAVFSNIYRILKKNSHFCLVMGQGKAKISSDYDIIYDLTHRLEAIHGFSLIFSQERKIGNRVIQVGGVDKESILVFKKL